MIQLFLGKALLCIAHVGCYPVLVGNTTPVGEYTMEHVIVVNGGISENVLKITESGVNRIVAIHRPPNATRVKLLEQQSTDKITNGCINVTPELFDYLVENYNNQTIKITK